MATCNVCCETFNKSTRKSLTCGFCEYEACSGCHKTYLLSSNQDAHCMNCRRVWDREFMDGLFTKAFIDGDYKRHREIVLYDRERSMFPETMPYVEIVKYVADQYTKIGLLTRQRKAIEKEIDDLPEMPVGLTKEYLERCVKEEDLFIKRAEITARITMIAAFNNRLTDYSSHSNIERKQFIRACPANECRGFLSSSWKCGLCNVWVCPDCHEIIGMDKDTNHTCLPDNLATAKFLEKDTRACPTCATMIHKINGCNQMFCTQCHTAFDWKTGNIETGRIHNPHYFEFMRRNGGDAPREVGDIPCGGMVHENLLNTKLREIGVFIKFPTEYNLSVLFGIIQCHNHVSALEIPFNQVNIVDQNRDLRVKFIMNEIDEATFKRTIQQREKTNTKKGEFIMVWQMFLHTSADIMRRFMEEVKNNTEIVNYSQELDALRLYTNECLEKIGKRYKNVPKRIDDDWIVTAYRRS